MVDTYIPPPPPPPITPPPDMYMPAGTWASATPTSQGGTYAPAPDYAAQTAANNAYVGGVYQDTVNQTGGNLTKDPAKYAAISAAYQGAVGPSQEPGTYSPGSGLSSFSGTPLSGGGGGVGSGSVFNTGTSPVPYPSAGGLTPSPISPAIPSSLPPPPPPPSSPPPTPTTTTSPSVFNTGTSPVPYLSGRDAIAAAMAGVTPTSTGGGSYTFSDPTAPPPPPPPPPSFADRFGAAPSYDPNSFANRFADFPNAGQPSQYTTSPYTNVGGTPQGPSPLPPGYSPPFSVDQPGGALPGAPFSPPAPFSFDDRWNETGMPLSQAPNLPSYITGGVPPPSTSLNPEVFSNTPGPSPSGDTLTPADLGIPFGGGAGGIMNQGDDGGATFAERFGDWPTSMRDFQSPANNYGTFQLPKTEAPVVGTASTYDPTAPGWRTGGMEMASGQTYDPSAFSAAIQNSLRSRFGGVRYGQPPTSGLVESPGGQQAIVGVNDTGPLVGGRVMDLSTAAMKYFNPSASANSGLMPNMRITPYFGSAPPGPVGPIGQYGPQLPTPGVPPPTPITGPMPAYTPTTGFVRR